MRIGLRSLFAKNRRSDRRGLFRNSRWNRGGGW